MSPFDFVKALPVTLKKVFDNWREVVRSFRNTTSELGIEVKEAKDRDTQGIEISKNETEALNSLKNDSDGQWTSLIKIPLLFYNCIVSVTEHLWYVSSITIS